MDALLQALHDVSVLLLPFVGLICLIFLAVFLYRLTQAIKMVPSTLERVNQTLEDVDTTVVYAQDIVDKLNEPVDTIVGVAKTVDKVNSAANGLAGTVVNLAVKNSDSILNWGKDIFGSKKQTKDTESVDDSQLHEEEDFGVYE